MHDDMGVLVGWWGLGELSQTCKGMQALRRNGNCCFLEYMRSVVAQRSGAASRRGDTEDGAESVLLQLLLLLIELAGAPGSGPVTTCAATVGSVGVGCAESAARLIGTGLCRVSERRCRVYGVSKRSGVDA